MKKKRKMFTIEFLPFRTNEKQWNINELPSNEMPFRMCWRRFPIRQENIFLFSVFPFSIQLSMVCESSEGIFFPFDLHKNERNFYWFRRMWQNSNLIKNGPISLKWFRDDTKWKTQHFSFILSLCRHQQQYRKKITATRTDGRIECAWLSAWTGANNWLPCLRCIFMDFYEVYYKRTCCFIWTFQPRVQMLCQCENKKTNTQETTWANEKQTRKFVSSALFFIVATKVIIRTEGKLHERKPKCRTKNKSNFR